MDLTKKSVWLILICGIILCARDAEFKKITGKKTVVKVTSEIDGSENDDTKTLVSLNGETIVQTPTVKETKADDLTKHYFPPNYYSHYPCNPTTDPVPILPNVCPTDNVQCNVLYDRTFLMPNYQQPFPTLILCDMVADPTCTTTDPAITVICDPTNLECLNLFKLYTLFTQLMLILNNHSKPDSPQKPHYSNEYYHHEKPYHSEPYHYGHGSHHPIPYYPEPHYNRPHYHDSYYSKPHYSQSHYDRPHYPDHSRPHYSSHSEPHNSGYHHF